MIKKIIWAVFFLLCICSAAYSQVFTINVSFTQNPNNDPHSAYEGEIKYYRVDITLNGTLPSAYRFVSTVTNGTVTQEYLVPSFPPTQPVQLYIEVQWDCGQTSGTIEIKEKNTGITNPLYTTSIISLLSNHPTYCKTVSPVKQNLHYSQTPDNITVTNCNTNCNPSSVYEYQWQVGDVPIGVFPQEPAPGTWVDVQYPTINPPHPVSYQPPAYTVDCIKAYRRLTKVNGTIVSISDIAVVSTFDYLNGGIITWNNTFNNGVPGISNTAATGGLCDGYNYLYTWEFSTDNINWTQPGSGQHYPTTLQIPGPVYIRRRVDCNGETEYSNKLFINPAPINAGIITNTGASTLSFNTVPSITQTAASGSACNAPDYIYTWERSINNGPWLAFGIASVNYPANYGIIGTCKIRRKVHCVYEDAYSNELSFTMIPYTSSNSENLNYVRTNNIVIPGVHSWEQADALPTGDKLQSTSYQDAFGRTIQSVIKQGSFIPSSTGADPANNINNYQDIVSYIKFDELGRADRAFLPYATTTNLGFYKTNAAAEQQSFNNQKYGEPVNSIFTYTQTTFDGSPLNRPINLKLPGSALNNDVNYKGVSSDYDFNKMSENVRIWDIGFNLGDKPISSGVYGDNKLFKNTITDEKGKVTLTYKDQSGKIILKRVQLANNITNPSTDGGDWISTYYVYDDLGRLRYTITPKAVEELKLPLNNWIIDDDIKKGLCFYQEYDKRGRVIVKHSPDAGEVMLVYDNRDRLVFNQDENQRNRTQLNPAKLNQWTFSLYDEHDRVLVTGLIDDARSRQNMQLMVDQLSQNAQNKEVEIYTGGGQGNIETIIAYNPVAGKIPATSNYHCQSCTATYTNSVNFYDDYTHRSFFHKAKNLSLNDFANINSQYIDQPVITTTRIRGLPTVSKIRILDDKYDNGNISDEKFLTTTTYYDEKGRVIIGLADNIKGGIDESAVLYDYSGKVLCTRGKHSAPIANNGFDNLLVVTKNDYDLLGRPTKLWKLYTKNTADIGNSSKYKKLSEIKLDEFGRGKTKTIGDDPNNPGSPLETMDYSYNIQGWLTGVNKDYALANTNGNMTNQWERKFGFYLGYDNGDGNFINKQYNGSITGAIWRSQGDNIQRKYNYDYDNIGRFKAASFTQKDNGISGNWSSTLVDISASVSSYDANGNIINMVQNGIVPGTVGGVIIDNLQYQYFNKSNKLKGIDDIAFLVINVQNGKQGDFKNFTPSTGLDYDYDFNGNLKNDRNKNIIDNTSDGIVSNFLNLPQTIIVKDKSKTEYTYDAAGSKLAKKVTDLTPNPPAPVAPVITWYIGGFVYEETGATTALQYILNEEGKLRITDITINSTPAGTVQSANTGNVDFGLGAKWGVWDYYLKDNLSNTRMVLTEEGHMLLTSCTMEATPAALASDEQNNFGNAAPNNEVFNTRTPNQVPGWNSNTTLASKLAPTAGAGTAVGPNVILKVMAGDIINAGVDYFYQPNTPQTQTNILTNIVQSLFGVLTGNPNVSGGVKSEINANYLQNNPNSPLPPFLSDYHPPTNDNRPRAYLNYIFFDEQFRYVGASSGASMVQGDGDGQPRLFIPVNIVKATKNGYVYVYLSNETPNMPVYFDNFVVSHVRGPIVEDNAYYPYGLKIQGISSRAAGKAISKQGYQGNYNEHDEETGYNEFTLRSYDPQIGRWLQIDPYNEFSSGYMGMGNDPVNNVDEDGGGVGDPIPTLPEVIVHSFAKKIAAPYTNLIVSKAITFTVNKSSYTAMNMNGSTSSFLIPAVPNLEPSISFNGQTYVYAGNVQEKSVTWEWDTPKANPITQETVLCPTCPNLTTPYEKQHVADADIFGNGHIGPRETVEAGIRAVRVDYTNQVADNIRGGPVGAWGMIRGGPELSFAGAAVDGVIMSFGGITDQPQTRFFGALQPFVVPKDPGIGYGVNDPAVRISGPWTKQDLYNGLYGRAPKSFGNLDLHHGDQMPGSGIHEIHSNIHRGNTQLHPQGNQGVTPQMRSQDKNLHWFYRSREMGGGNLYPNLIFNPK